MRIKALVLLLAATAWGCADASPPPLLEQEQTDDSLLVLEGQDVLTELDQDLASRTFSAPAVFTRLGLMWDAPSSGALELRTSPDRSSWSEWQAPVETFQEEGIFSGHLDVPEGAQHFQYRLLDESTAPTWVNVVPVEEIPVMDDDGPVAFDDTEEHEAPVGDVPPRSGSFTIQSRASWGARPPRCVATTIPNRVTIHHTVTPTNDSMSVPARLRQIQAFHMYTMGWCDIGYNFLLSRDGRVWRGRGRNVLGAHVANHNSGNVGISFLGTYSSTKANQSQRCGAAAMLRWLHGKVPAIVLTRDDIKGHRQYAATECPGDALYGQLSGIVTLAKNGGCD